MGIYNIEEIPLKTSKEELLRQQRFGPVSLRKVEEALDKRGLSLPDHSQKEVDLSSIESLNISTRAKGVLFRTKIYTVDILTMYTPEKLLQLQDFGVLSLNEVVTALSQRGRTLRSDDY